LRLEKYLGTTPEFWMNLQARYDIKIARKNTWEKIEKNIRPIHAA